MPIGLKGNSDGSGAIQIGGSDAISISTGLNTTFAGTITASGGVMYPLTSGTAVASTSGTSIDFTGIPSWVKRITVMLNGVSTNGSSQLQIQIGSGSVTTSGYVSASGYAGSTNAAGSGTITSGHGLDGTGAGSGWVRYGSCRIENITGNTWVFSHSVGLLSSGTPYFLGGGGSLALGGTLDRVRITTVNGTDAFDAGTINILYE